MTYDDGQIVQIGDKVRLSDDRWHGVVVCLIEEGKFTAQYPESAWGYLKIGALVEFKEAGLVHYDTIEPDIELVARATPQAF